MILRSFLFCIALLPPIAAAAEPSKDQHIILISLDGFPARIWNDPSAPLPALRKLAAAGAQANAMTVSNPSVTWINHTTLVTGVTPRRHGVLFNGLLVRQSDGRPPKVEQWVDKTQLVLVPTLYDIAHAAGLTTAETNWPATTRAKTIDWSFAELPDVNGKVERDMIADGNITQEQILWMLPGRQRKNATFLDATFSQASQFIFAKYRPNLLLHHLFNTDHLHHLYGPNSAAGFTALAYADRLVGDLVRTVEDSGLRERTTFVISTDHGFKKISKIVFPNVALKKAGYAKATGPMLSTGDAAAMAQGGICFIYVTDPSRKAVLLPKLKELFAQIEGVDRVLDGSSGPDLGMPGPAENQGMGDLILYPKPGYAFKSEAAGDEVIAAAFNYGGTHGYLASDPELDGIFIASGKGIRKGVVLPRVSNLDVAPTIATLMGLVLPEIEGRVLTEILTSAH